MKRYNTKNLVIYTILLLMPIILYSLYKNGYLIYQKGLIDTLSIFKIFLLIGIGLLIKVVIDLIRYKKVIIDYDILNVILIAMIMPYNINIYIYSISLLLLYILSLFLERFIKFNKVCFIYLIIIIITYYLGNLTFKNPLELNYAYSFNFLDLFAGRGIGGIASTSILFSLIAYLIFLSNYYYKKNIPLFINITYLLLAFILFIVKGNSTFLINGDLVFASIFIATIPLYSPYNIKHQIIYSILIGISSFLIAYYLNSIISIYIAIFILSLVPNLFRKWA